MTAQVIYASASEVRSSEQYNIRTNKDDIPQFVRDKFANIESVELIAVDVDTRRSFMGSSRKRYFAIRHRWNHEISADDVRRMVNAISDFSLTETLEGAKNRDSYYYNKNVVVFLVKNGNIECSVSIDIDVCKKICAHINFSAGELTFIGKPLRPDEAALFCKIVRDRRHKNMLSIPRWCNRRIEDPVGMFNYCMTSNQSDPSYVGPERSSWDGFAKKGVKRVVEQLLPLLDGLRSTSMLHYCALYEIFSLAGRTMNDVAVSKVINAHFAEKKDVPSVISAINLWFMPGIPDGIGEKDERPFASWFEVMTDYNPIEKSFVFVPSYYEARKQALKSKGGGAIAKLTREVGSLSVSERDHPLMHAAISEGRIPLGTFFRKSEQYFPFNQNWDLWEKMLAKYPEDAIELAKTVTGRTTYEKDLMSYFWFILHELPEYLKRHTGHEWTVKPRIVHNVSELEPPTEGQSSIQRKRSALTPSVDNENRTVEVPYASIVISGNMTTYTYGLDFMVLKRGLTFNGNVCVRELEEKLNGRDDYGLMFYTLTGSPQGRGYPTFLIIFERRDKSGDTHVHFHRVHPSRSKNGDYNPIDQWTVTAWNWMHGNISAERIVAQQGDFVLNTTEKAVNIADCTMQQAYDDSHRFSRPVPVLIDDGNSDKYRIGWVVLDSPVTIIHHEHNDITVPSGTYEMRQIRSWEANPVAIWTRAID